MKIIGATVGTTTPKPNFDQTDPKKGDYIKGDRSFLRIDETLTESGISADAKAVGDAVNLVKADIDMLSDLVGKSPVAEQIGVAIADKADAEHNHSDLYYTEAEVDEKLDSKADAASVPTALSDLVEDETHRTVTDAEKEIWNIAPIQFITWGADD